MFEAINDFVESANRDNQMHIDSYLQIKKSFEEFMKNNKKQFDSSC